MYNYLGLVNDVNRRLNEVELKSSNFATATGFYSAAKEAVNSSIRNINFQEYEWPFNHVTAEETLNVGQVRYGYPTDAKTVNMESFRLKRDDSLGLETRKLKILDYEEYLDKYADSEYNISDTSIRSIPAFVFRTPALEFGLYPAPDKAYEVVYEYYRLPVDLNLYTDVPTVPEQFRHVIIEGAMYYAYLFRGNTQDAMVSKDLFDVGLKSMRSLYINRYEYLRSTVVSQPTYLTNSRV